jgi:hypothetical protein
MCPGCREPHVVALGAGPGLRWTWNGDFEKPTLYPTVLISTNRPVALNDPEVLALQIERFRHDATYQIPYQVHVLCFSRVTDGRIHFLDDTRHSLAGQTVDLPQWRKP